MDKKAITIGNDYLAGLYNEAIDHFDYVHLGRSFRPIFQTSLLRLDSARLKLSRWGQAVGLDGEFGDQQVSLTTQDSIRADTTLRQILALFSDAERTSIRLKSEADSNDSSIQPLQLDQEMDPTGLSLHETMRAIAIRRQNNTLLKRKTGWIMHSEEQFTALLEGVIRAIDDLDQVSTVDFYRQQSFCEREITLIGINESLHILKGIAAAQDKDLEAAISKVMKHNEAAPASWTIYNYNGKQVITGTINGSQNITF